MAPQLKSVTQCFFVLFPKDLGAQQQADDLENSGVEQKTAFRAVLRKMAFSPNKLVSEQLQEMTWAIKVATLYAIEVINLIFTVLQLQGFFFLMPNYQEKDKA